MACEVPPLGTPQLDPLCNIGSAINSKASQVMSDWADQVEKWIGEAAATMIKACTTAWVSITTPGVVIPGTDTPSDSVNFIQESVKYFSLVILIGALIVAMGQMAWMHKADPGKTFGVGLVRYILVAGAGTVAVGVLLTVGDAFSVWIINRATGSDFATALMQMIKDTGGLGFILIIILSGLGIIVTGLQVVLLIFRGGAVIVLCGTLPLAAAAATTETGKPWFQKHVGWLLAYILYKPAAAIFYAAAFKLMSTSDYTYDDTKTIEHIAGYSLLIMALIALPAMIKLVSPLTTAVASGRGFGAAAMGAMAVVIPTGAVALKAASGGVSTSTSNGSAAGPSGSVPPPPPPAPPGGSTVSRTAPQPVTP